MHEMQLRLQAAFDLHAFVGNELEAVHQRDLFIDRQPPQDDGAVSVWEAVVANLRAMQTT